MIVIKLIGGLGNQLFQYALGRCLAYKHQTELRLDISEFETRYTLHKYCLNFFNINAEIASPETMRKFRFGAQKDFFSRVLDFTRTKTPDYIKEPHFNFWAEILELEVRGDLYLDGYWQSEKYFKDVDGLLRKELVLRESAGDNIAHTRSSIHEKESISIHVRRGDYVTNEKTYKVHGVCSADYYMRAVKILERTVDDPHFFIFSDDIKWAEKNIKLGYPMTFVSRGSMQNYQDLVLMGECKHNIIANSSFSWWGAWLNSNPNKIVIAPKKWLNDQSINTKDLLPESWIRI